MSKSGRRVEEFETAPLAAPGRTLRPGSPVGLGLERAGFVGDGTLDISFSGDEGALVTATGDPYPRPRLRSGSSRLPELF